MGYSTSHYLPSAVALELEHAWTLQQRALDDRFEHKKRDDPSTTLDNTSTILPSVSVTPNAQLNSSVSITSNTTLPLISSTAPTFTGLDTPLHSSVLGLVASTPDGSSAVGTSQAEMRRDAAAETPRFSSTQASVRPPAGNTPLIQGTTLMASRGSNQVSAFLTNSGRELNLLHPPSRTLHRLPYFQAPNRLPRTI